MSVWLLILALAGVTLLERLSFLLWSDRWTMPDWAERGLAYVPVTVLAALILPSIMRNNGAIDLSLVNPKLIASVVAVLLIWKTRNVLLTIVVGMIVFWGMNWLL